MSSCKIDCQRTNVSKEDWVRSEGYTRRELKEVTTVLNRIEGRLDITNKLPQVCADIAGQVVSQMQKKGGSE